MHKKSLEQHLVQNGSLAPTGWQGPGARAAGVLPAANLPTQPGRVCPRLYPGSCPSITLSK